MTVTTHLPHHAWTAMPQCQVVTRILATWVMRPLMTATEMAFALTSSVAAVDPRG